MQDLQLVAERCILEGLQRAGVVRGDVEQMLTKRVAALFMPHGVHLCPFPSHLRHSRRRPVLG